MKAAEQNAGEAMAVTERFFARAVDRVNDRFGELGENAGAELVGSMVGGMAAIYSAHLLKDAVIDLDTAIGEVALVLDS